MNAPRSQWREWLLIASPWLMLVALGFLATSCASAPPSYPLRGYCLRDPGTGYFLTGTVIQEREDGAKLFLADDRSWGDHGFIWYEPEKTNKTLRPCTSTNHVQHPQWARPAPPGERP
jgi:hypothetical protein